MFKFLSDLNRWYHVAGFNGELRQGKRSLETVVQKMFVYLSLIRSSVIKQYWRVHEREYK
jgi:hypothetical protein